MKTTIVNGLLLSSAIAIAGLSWRCIVLQGRYDQTQSQSRLQTSSGADWHKIALSTVDMVRHDWIVIDTQERRLEEMPEIFRLACTSGGGTLRYCSGITSSLAETLKKMRSDVESMRESKDAGMLELEKLENALPARN